MDILQVDKRGPASFKEEHVQRQEGARTCSVRVAVTQAIFHPGALGT